MKRILIIFTIIIALCGATLAQQSNLIPFQLDLSGRLISGLDPSKLIDTSGQSPQISNFATLTNMEYTDNGIRSIRGFSSITTNRLTSHPRINNIFHFVKSNPAETHVLVQARNTDDKNSQIFVHSTSTPNRGTFTPVALHIDADGASGTAVGRFSDAPIGHVVYCNSAETPQVWGGIENSPGFVSIFDGADPDTTSAWSLDYTDAILNSKTDSDNILTFKRNSTTSSVTAYIVARLPLQGIKFYVETANTNATTTTSLRFWNGSTMTAVSNFVDGTSSGGTPLAVTGIMSFDSTESTAKVRIVDGIYGYFYKLTVPNGATATTISRITVDEPFQNLRDFWDGQFRKIAHFSFVENSILKVATTNVLDDEFTLDESTDFDASTYADIKDVDTGTEWLEAQFPERMMGLNIKIIPAHEQTLVTNLVVEYWDGENWQAVSNLRDATSSGGKTFNHSGVVTWTPLAENVEFKKQHDITSAIKGVSGEPLYSYRLTVDSNKFGNAAGLFVYHISGVPVQKKIGNFLFSLNAQGRLFLFNDQSSERNTSIVSNVATLNVLNGEDSGDPLTYGNNEGVKAAIAIHLRTTAGSRENILVLKNNATHLLLGENPEEWEVVTISDRIGCNAPLTLTVSSIGLEFAPLQSRQIAMWQGNAGIYIWDGTSIIPISDPIDNYFDQSRPEAINLDKANLSRAFFEVHDSNHYYHWMFSSKATSTNDLDTELVFDVKRQGWFRIDRAGKPLQAGTQIVSTSTGSTFSYGVIDDGDLMRLEHKTDWDGLPLTSVFETGDIPLSGSIMNETELRYLRVIMAAKETTNNSLGITHFKDTEATGTTFSLSPSRSGFRLAMPVHAPRDNTATFHRFRASMTTSAETRGFSPMALGGFFRITREVHR